MVKIQDCRKITDQFRGICRIYPNLIKGNRRLSTCNRLDLQTLGFQSAMPKNLPDHCSERPNVCMWYIVLVLQWVLEMGGFYLM